MNSGKSNSELAKIKNIEIKQFIDNFNLLQQNRPLEKIRMNNYNYNGDEDILLEPTYYDGEYRHSINSLLEEFKDLKPENLV